MVVKTPYHEIRDSLQTGDLVFFSGNGWESNLIKIGTRSEWSHVGMVIKVDILDLVLVWESTTLSTVKDLMTNEFRSGVQVTPLSHRIAEYDGYTGFRQMKVPEVYPDYKEVIRDLRRELDGKPYEESRMQLLASALELNCLDKRDRDLSSVFCSELCAETLIRVGLLPKGRASLTYSPAELAEHEFKHLKAK